ncbi:MAG: hypothetical protein JF607_23755 [Burkholderiales bacterium]|jgi:hypothetical protein|nr:hypothetical protein [Burkholderiales bacterium]
MSTDDDLKRMQPTEEMRNEAKRHPNGYVYVIRGDIADNEAVPPEAIRGAWKVDAQGEIVPDSFVANPRYRAWRI